MVAAVTTVYILIAIQLEERDLTAMLGEAYAGYRDRVPALIPFRKSGRVAKISSGETPSADE